MVCVCAHFLLWTNNGVSIGGVACINGVVAAHEDGERVRFWRERALIFLSSCRGFLPSSN